MLAAVESDLADVVADAAVEFPRVTPWYSTRTSWAGCARALALNAEGEGPDDDEDE